MDIKTISATLAILGTGLTLSACKKATTDATEVPASTPGAEANCGADKGHGHANCSGDKAADEGDATKPEGSCGGEKGEKSCGAKGDGSCGGDKTTATPPGDATASSTAVAADATKPAAEATTTPAKKKKSAGKKTAKGDASCGEGTCA